MNTRRIRLSSELTYLLSLILMAFSVAMVTTTDFGLSMVVAPAYLVSQKLSFLSFGQAEYVVQGLLFAATCILLRQFRLLYLGAFVSGLIYGAALDFWQLVIPHFNAAITVPGSLPFGIRVIYFAAGITITAFAIALQFRIYLYPQVYEFFVKYVSARFHINSTKFKWLYDIASLLLSLALTLLFFGKIVGIGVGTLVTTAVNGLLIGLFGKLIDRFVIFQPSFPKLARLFEPEAAESESADRA